MRALFLLCLCAFSLPIHAQQMPGLTPRVEEILAAAAAANQAGDAARGREILEQGVQTLAAAPLEVTHLYGQLAVNYADLGLQARGLEAAERMLEVGRHPVLQWVALGRALSLSASLHDKERMRRYSARLDEVMGRLRGLPTWSLHGQRWQAGTAWAKANAERQMGHLEPAENGYKACITAAQQHLQSAGDNPHSQFFLLDCTGGAMAVQMTTGQLAAASALADQLRAGMSKIEADQRRPGVVARVSNLLGQLALEQGRHEEARRLLQDNLARLGEDKESGASLRAARARLDLARLEMLLGNWPQALEWHRQREAALAAMGKERGAIGAASPDYAYTLLRTDKPADALRMIQRVVEARRELFDAQSLSLLEARAFAGVILAGNGRRAEALAELRSALPALLEVVKGERSSAESGVMRTARLNWLLDGYINLLADEAQAGDAGALDEAFRMADLARGSTVQRALAASASRAAIADPQLAALARQEQDLQREISSLSEAIGNLLARGRVAEEDKVVADMRAALATLRQRHLQAQAEIERRFPDYAALLNPKPVGIAAIQKLLHPQEAVIALYAGRERTLVWAVPAVGPARLGVASLGAAALEAQVASLRAALDPNAEATGALPRFPFDISHGLYRQLLVPVLEGWQGASELIVIPHGRLGLLPFGLLTRAPFTAPPAAPEFAEMAAASWLIKDVAISQLPAAVALPALRSGKATVAARAFVGFGDPLFVAAATPAAAATTTRAGHALQRRKLAVAPTMAEAGTEMAPAVNFSLLPPLPDTALEVEEVGRLLGAEAARDIHLGRRASEARVKQADLAPYRVVMFATHGLMGGEMPGLYQPALAMANPALSGDGEDGMLTMEEILGLKLNADWVVLSACNSAAAGGQSVESVSGLGRAFFYAGAKSLLVTNWAVETESARLLTTAAFRAQAADPTLPRAQALRRASLELMGKSAGNSFSYAHPMFWAPYSLVGDGGR